MKEFKINAEIWKYEGPTPWYFVTVPDRLYDQIKFTNTKQVGWGSIKVQAQIGETTWQTSLFPSKTKEYHLPIKSIVRKKEQLKEGDHVDLKITLINAI